MQERILGLGNALVDILVRIPNDNLLRKFGLPKGAMNLVDESRSAEIFEAVKDLRPQIVCGGSAANTICGLANMGVSTGFMGMTGGDDLGEQYEADLRGSGVETLMTTSSTRTGSCISLITPDSERTMCTCLGAAVEMGREDVDTRAFDDYSHLYLEGYLVQNPELIESVLPLAKQKGMTTMLDLASFNVVEENLELLQRLIAKYVDVVFANEEEATAFTGKEDEEALNEMGEMAECVVLKQGRRGSLVKVGDKRARVGIVKANPIDTTGAGDLYASGFIWAKINGFSPVECATAGAVTSGNVIEVIGSKMDANRWTNIRQTLKRLLPKND